MSEATTPPITSEQFDAWLLSFPTRERKTKERILAKQLRVSERTIENWRQGRPIQAKHHEAIRDAMRGTEKVSVDFDEDTYKRLEVKATEKGFKTVGEYLTELTKGFLALALLGVLTYQIAHPSDQQARRIGRRREAGGLVEVTAEA